MLACFHCVTCFKLFTIHQGQQTTGKHKFTPVISRWSLFFTGGLSIKSHSRMRPCWRQICMTRDMERTGAVLHRTMGTLHCEPDAPRAPCSDQSGEAIASASESVRWIDSVRKALCQAFWVQYIPISQNAQSRLRIPCTLPSYPPINPIILLTPSS